MIWASAVLERWARVVERAGVGGGAGRRWIESGRARKRAWRRDQRASCHCHVKFCECCRLGLGWERKECEAKSEEWFHHTMMMSSGESPRCF